jgi:transcriptional regulator with PAS, ATPase and Fis domain
VLQGEEIRPVGSNQIKKVNVRIITASSSSLLKMVTDKKFREDLYFRLNVYPIFVPSLGERIEDIPMLADHFLRKFSTQQEKEIEEFSAEVLDFMKQRHWPGNIRELENFIERLVTLTTKKQKIIDRKILPAELQKELKKSKKNFTELPINRSLSESLSNYEEEFIRNTLISCKWNQSKAARLLKISEHDIRYKMKKLKIMKPV